VVPLDPDSPLVQAAARVFRGRSCAGCHYLKNIWGYDGLPLDHAAEKYDRDTLKRFIRNPKSVNARTLMPPQDKTTDAEIDAIANLLAGLPRAGTNSSSSHEHH
jgi:mono/diheme cytochrome c family protein